MGEQQPTNERLARLSEEELIEHITNPIEQDEYRRELVRRLGARGLTFTEFFGEEEGSQIHIHRPEGA